MVKCTDLFGIPNLASDVVKARARRERMTLSSMCMEEADCSRDYREHLALAAATALAGLILFTAGMSAIGGGGWIGIIIGVVFLAVSAAYAITSAWATDKAIRKREELMGLWSRLRNQRANFERELRLMNALCCPDVKMHPEMTQ